MKKLHRVEVAQYDPTRYGLFKSKHRKARLYVREIGRHAKTPDDPARTYRPLLEAIYERVARSPLAPLPWPERVRAHWSEEDGAFILDGFRLNGFSVMAEVRTVPDVEEHQGQASERAIEEQHGTPLPKIAL